MDCVVLCSYGLKKKTTAQDSHFHSHETVELPTAAAPHSKIYLTAKNRKQIHSVTFFQPPAVDITMYICVCVSQEDFFFWWRHKKSRSYQTIFNLVYYLGKFSTECFHLILPWQPLVFDCRYVVSYSHIIAQRKATQNLFKVKYFLTEVTKQWPPSFLILWRHPTPVLKTDACIILNPLIAVLSFPRLWMATNLQLKSLTD